MSFTQRRLDDPDGTIASYAWTFGDGGTGSGRRPHHTYTTAGTFTATLKVTDNAGATATKSFDDHRFGPCAAGSADEPHRHVPARTGW